MIGETLVLAMNDEDIFKLIIIGGAMTVGLAVVVTLALKGYLQTREVERTRREVAAYVAEGTISPEDAGKLLGRGNSDFEKQIGTAVSWGMISAGKAEKLIKAMRDDQGERNGA